MKPRVLVVDDEADFVQLLQYNLGLDGFETFSASNGVEALHQARRVLPDVILLDLMLPDIDGFSVREILRSQPSTADIPVIVISALDGEYVTARSIETAVAGRFKKPVDSKALGESIRVAIEQRREQMQSQLGEQGKQTM